jgi:hypothetical protein
MRSSGKGSPETGRARTRARRGTERRTVIELLLRVMNLGVPIFRRRGYLTGTNRTQDRTCSLKISDEYCIEILFEKRSVAGPEIPATESNLRGIDFSNEDPYRDP